MSRLFHAIGAAMRADRHLRQARRDHSANLDPNTSDGLLEGCMKARRTFLLGRLAIDWNRDFHLLLLFCFAARDLDMLSNLLAAYAPEFRCRISFGPTRLVPGNAVAEWSILDGVSTFRIPDVRVDMTGLRITTRWASLIPLFTKMAAARQLPEIALNLDDAGQRPGLAFCANDPAFVLIPDSEYFAEYGYHEAGRHFAAHAPAWERRQNKVLWRGVPTGVVAPGEVLPRIALCEKVQAEAPDLFDCGFTDVSLLPLEQQAELTRSGFVKAFVPWQALATYKYHIDIDGNTNAWSGLFRKLLSGGVVFKVMSPGRYRQWYYDRLRPWENFVPVDADLGNLIDVVTFLIARDELARRIADAGKALALSLDFDSQLQVAVDAISSHAR